MPEHLGPLELLGVMAYESRTMFDAPLAGVRNAYPATAPAMVFGDGQARHWLLVFLRQDDPAEVVVTITMDGSERPLVYRESRANLTVLPTMTEGVFPIGPVEVDSDAALRIVHDVQGTHAFDDLEVVGMLLRRAPPLETPVWIVHAVEPDGEHRDWMAIDAMTGDVVSKMDAVPEPERVTLFFEEVLHQGSANATFRFDVDQVGFKDLALHGKICKMTPGPSPAIGRADPFACSPKGTGQVTPTKGYLNVSVTDPWGTVTTLDIPVSEQHDWRRALGPPPVGPWRIDVAYHFEEDDAQERSFAMSVSRY
ncbi:MAG: hypothetical protein KY455_10400 [Euryarchaeota archaeon]|nr:hypothetical protein [Euryarchaeota archaeon]